MIAYPDVQKKVQSEIDMKIGRSRTVDLSDRPNLHNTRATIPEVIRINPVVPVSVPYLSTAATTISCFDVDKGTDVIANFKSVNHDETIWKSPELFKPEKHLDGDGDLKKRSSTTAFGFGRRKWTVLRNGCVFLVTKRRTPLPRLRLLGTGAFLYRLTPAYTDHMTGDR